MVEKTELLIFNTAIIIHKWYRLPNPDKKTSPSIIQQKEKEVVNKQVDFAVPADHRIRI